MQLNENLGNICLKVLNETETWPSMTAVSAYYAINEHKIRFINAFNELSKFLYSRIQSADVDETIREVNKCRNALMDVFDKISVQMNAK